MSAQLTDSDYELLSAYLDGELSDSERLDLEGRLESEPLLRRELSLLRQTVALLHGLPELQAPRNFTLDERAAPPLRVIRPPRRLLTLNRLTAVAAMLLVVCFAGFVLVSQFGPSVGNISDNISLATNPQAGEVALAPSVTDVSPAGPLTQMGGDQAAQTDAELNNATQTFGFMTSPENESQATDEGILNDGITATGLTESDDTRDVDTTTDLLPAVEPPPSASPLPPLMTQPETGIGGAGGGMGGGVPSQSEEQPAENFAGTMAYAATPPTDQPLDTFAAEPPSPLPTSEVMMELVVPGVAQEDTGASAAVQAAPAGTQIASGEAADSAVGRKAQDVPTFGISPAVVFTFATITIVVVMTFTLIID